MDMFVESSSKTSSESSGEISGETLRNKDQIIEAFRLSEDYRDFLVVLTEKKLLGEFSRKAKLAKCLGLSGSFLTRILTKRANLSFEQAENLAKLLNFSGSETLALYDKITLARTQSEESRFLLNARIRSDYYETWDEPVIDEIEQTPAPNTMMHYRVLSRMMDPPGITAAQLAKSLDVSADRLKAILEDVMRHRPITKTVHDSVVHYHYDAFYRRSNRSKPSSPDLSELGMMVRRMASQSYESRYPISIVDRPGNDHYVSSSFVSALKESQINELLNDLTLLTIKIHKMIDENEQSGPDQKTNEKVRMVGLCLDLFDVI